MCIGDVGWESLWMGLGIFSLRGALCRRAEQSTRDTHTHIHSILSPFLIYINSLHQSSYPPLILLSRKKRGMAQKNKKRERKIQRERETVQIYREPGRGKLLL